MMEMSDEMKAGHGRHDILNYIKGSFKKGANYMRH